MSIPEDEVSFIVMLGSAMRNGNEAGDQWDLNNWYPCGSASVLVKPRNSKFAHWLVDNEYGRSNDYLKAIIVSAPMKYGQVMKAQTLWASAAAKTLREVYDIDASVWSFID